MSILKKMQMDVMVLVVSETLLNRIKQTMVIEPIVERNNYLEFKYGEKMYNFSIVDCFDGEDRMIMIVGAAI